MRFIRLVIFHSIGSLAFEVSLIQDNGHSCTALLWAFPPSQLSFRYVSRILVFGVWCLPRQRDAATLTVIDNWQGPTLSLQSPHTTTHLNFTLLFLSSLWSDLSMWGHFLIVLNLRNLNLRSLHNFMCRLRHISSLQSEHKHCSLSRRACHWRNAIWFLFGVRE